MCSNGHHTVLQWKRFVSVLFGKGLENFAELLFEQLNISLYYIAIYLTFVSDFPSTLKICSEWYPGQRYIPTSFVTLQTLEPGFQ